MIKVIHHREQTNWPPHCTMYVGRPTPLGNPFTHIKDRKTKAHFLVDTREEAIESYRLQFGFLLNDNPVGGTLRHYLQPIQDQFDKLLDIYRRNNMLVLVCWCAPKSCHADILKEMILEKI